MGYYIETLGHARGKAATICEEHDAVLLASADEARAAFSQGMGVVCVVSNGPIEAAAFAYSMQELDYFDSSAMAGRSRTWLMMDRDKAEQLSGFSR